MVLPMLCQSKGVKLSINPGAHEPMDGLLIDMKYGVYGLDEKRGLTKKWPLKTPCLRKRSLPISPIGKLNLNSHEIRLRFPYLSIAKITTYEGDLIIPEKYYLTKILPLASLDIILEHLLFLNTNYSITGTYWVRSKWVSLLPQLAGVSLAVLDLWKRNISPENKEKAQKNWFLVWELLFSFLCFRLESFRES